jgi:cell fate (sporulation/competence/biofilm development) regulator YlbF (YheA/YmcA/DUF963 family)
MEDRLKERAQDLGRVIGQTPEYKALERARDRFSNDRSSVEAVNRLSELEGQIAQSLERGEEPTDPVKTQYEQVFSELQGSPIYQGMVAAQANFDRLLARVNEDISKGIESGAQSRIILPS